MKTKAIQLLVNSVLPEELRDYNRTYDKKSIDELMSLIADNYPDEYSRIIKDIADIGRNAAYISGETLTLNDFKPMFDKDSIIKQMREEAKVIKSNIKNKNDRKNALNDLYAKYAVLLEDMTMKAGDSLDNNLFNAVKSGAKGNSTQLKALTTTPGIYTDNKGNIIPFFINNSYAEGLTLPEYLSSTFGSRAAIVQNKRSTADAGFIGKLFSRIGAPLVVNKLRDTSPENVGLVVDPSSPEAYGRVLAKDVAGLKRGTVLDRDTQSYLRKHKVSKVLVHSPIATVSEDGISADAVGTNYNKRLPDIGYSAGITAGNAIGEPLAQGALNSKHTSGAYKGKKQISGIPYLEAFISSPKVFPDKATVATDDGKITAITDAQQGGKYIYIGDKKHYVLPNTEINVDVGDTVEAGDILSDGLADPEEIVKYKGLGEGRKYYSVRLKKLLDDSGAPSSLRNTEMLARSALDNVRITDPDGYGQYLPEDIVSYNKIEATYVPRKNSKEESLDDRNILGKYIEKPVLHYTIGTRITPSIIKNLKDVSINKILVNDDPPGFEPVFIRAQELNSKGSYDWLSRLQGSYLKSGLIDSAIKGLDTNIRENINPYSRMGQGYDFAENIDKGKF